MTTTKVTTPFFSFNPKSYLHGETLLKYAKAADQIAAKLNISIFVSAPYAELSTLAEQTKNIIVTAQHMDMLSPGRGMGAVLPESLVSAGAKATFLNHAEKPMYFFEIEKAVERAKQLDIVTILCANSLKEAKSLANLHPDILLCEPTELIGTGKTSDVSYVEGTNQAIRDINPDILIMQGAGISSPQDTYNVIYAGTDGTGCTSGILKAKDPFKMFKEMAESTVEAYKKRIEEEN